MNAERYQELHSGYLDGDLSPAEMEEFALLLKEDPARAEALRDDLRFVDLVEQSVQPERSFQAFLDGLETRVKAEETADVFMAELVSRLKEVDDRQAAEKKIVMFPATRRQRVALWGTAAAAAIAIIAAVPMFLRSGGSEAGGLGTLAFAEGVIWEKSENQPDIEWEAGAVIKAGTRLKVEESGRALLKMDGKSVTLVGPAELVIKSSTEGELLEGELIAHVESDGEPFVVHAPQMEVQIPGGAAGVRVIGDGEVETSVLSSKGNAVVEFDHGASDKLGPLQSIIASAPNARFSLIPFDAAPFQDHLPLLSGVTNFSNPVQVSAPGDGFAEAKTSTGHEGVILVRLESSRIDLAQPLAIDAVADARVETPTLAPAELPARESIRSYLVELDSLQSKNITPNKSGYVDAFITFNDTILGVSTSDRTLDLSDAVTGYSANTLQIAKRERGLEAGEKVHIRDDGRTLDLRMKMGDRTSLAQLRVFVKAR